MTYSQYLQHCPQVDNVDVTGQVLVHRLVGLLELVTIEMLRRVNHPENKLTIYV